MGNLMKTIEVFDSYSYRRYDKLLSAPESGATFELE